MPPGPEIWAWLVTIPGHEHPHILTSRCDQMLDSDHMLLDSSHAARPWETFDGTIRGDADHASGPAAGPDPGGGRAVRRRPHRSAGRAARGLGHDGPPRHRRAGGPRPGEKGGWRRHRPP